MLKRLDPFLGPQRLVTLRSSRQGKRISKNFRSGCRGRKAALPQCSHQEERHSS
jgi:hypothetical protein